MSSFFQNLLLFFGEDYSRVADQGSLTSIASHLSGLFVENYVEQRTQDDADPRDWLDEQLRQVFDLDVYHTEFPRERGYEIYEGRASAVLLLRMEDLNSCGRVAFKEFLNIDDFSVANANVGSDKSYALLYETFQSELTLPQEYLDSMYGSRMARHFYSAEELSEFRSRWKEY
ncbi:MAG: putative capsular polysaccharide synthesis family protein [Actinomycetes bacterium]